MRILFDESVPRPLRRHLRRHEIRTVPEAGWAGKDNGELLALAERDFDVMITADQNIPYQQNIAGMNLRVIVLKAPSNRLEHLEPLMAEARRKLTMLERGQIVRVGR